VWALVGATADERGGEGFRSMASHLTILIVDDDDATASRLDNYVTSAGHSARQLPATGVQPDYILSLRPDVLLVSLGADATEEILALCRAVSFNLLVCPIIMYGPASDVDTMQQAMAAGVRRFLTSPVVREELLRAIVETRTQAERNQARLAPPPRAVEAIAVPPRAPEEAPPRSLVCAVFGPKGGVGTSTLAVNLAVGLQLRGWRTALIDADMSHSSAAVLLDITSTSSILQLVVSGDIAERELIPSYLVKHQPSGLHVLLAPNEPEQNERITPDHLRAIIGVLRASFEAVVIDAGGHYDDRTLLVLDLADKIIVPATPDIAAARTLSSFLRISELVGHDQAKVTLVLMRSDSVRRPFIESIERYIGRAFTHQVVSDSVRATAALNSGAPLVLGNRSSRVAGDLMGLADRVAGLEPGRDAEPSEQPGLAADGEAAQDGGGAATRSTTGRRFAQSLRRPVVLPLALAVLILCAVSAVALATRQPTQRATTPVGPTPTRTLVVLVTRPPATPPPSSTSGAIGGSDTALLLNPVAPPRFTSPPKDLVGAPGATTTP